MSQFENIVAFEAALKESKELQEKFEAAKKRIVENNGATNKAELLAKAATEVGFALNVADLERAIAEAQELSEEELEQVSGGMDTVPVARPCPSCGGINIAVAGSDKITYFCSKCRVVY